MLNKLERKIGKYAIPNLIVYLLGGYVIGYLLYFGSLYTNLNFISFMTLEPYEIIHNFQFWRILTWAMIPPQTSLLFALIMMVFYYQLGTVLEHTIGTFRFNVFIFGGMFFTVLGAFALYGLVSAGIITTAFGPQLIGGAFSTSYINMSIFLAFAMCYPNDQVMLYFLIPIKMKWLAIVYVVMTLLNFVSGSWAARIAIVSSLLNVIIFFVSTRNLNRINPKEVHRRNAFKRASTPEWERPNRSGQPVARHKCAICGRTELTNPELEFSFCSKCNGNYEYCQDHLFTHQHVK
jgi:hypothetical protein